MIPMSFDYEVAESVDHAIELLDQHGDDSKIIAGGHSLIPLMRLRLAAPTVLIDLGRLDDLSYVRDDGDHLAIGDPAGDMPSVISALEGEIVVKGPDGERNIPALDFFQDYLMTALDDQE